MQDGLGENKTLIRKMMGEELIKDLKKEGMLSEEVSKNALEMSRIEAVSPLIDLGSPSTAPSQKDPSDDKDFDFGDDEEARMEFARKAFASQHNQASLYQADNPELALLRKQSIIDPDKHDSLLNYGLDSFKNSIWENFLGSQV